MSLPQPVWDLWIRLGHWLIIAGIIFQQISGENIDLINIHATVGILLGGWVLFRVIWGFTGPYYARFSSFPPPSPKTAAASLRRVLNKETEETPGHSAIGGLTVYLLITLIGLTALTGMASSDDIFFSGPLAPFLSANIVNFASRTHPILSKLVLATVVVHVLAVLWHQFAMRERLIQGMITGLKPGFGSRTPAPHPFSKMILFRGFVIFSICVVGTYVLLGLYLTG
jgi:cytochrome b